MIIRRTSVVTRSPEGKAKLNEDIKYEGDKGPCFGARHLQIVLLFIFTIVISAIRYSVSVAIIAMTDPNTSSNPDVKTYNWKNKNVILSSFYWGYIALQIFSAELTRFWGTKTMLLISMCANVVSVMLVPLIADLFGSYGVIVLRVTQGLFQGCFYPSIYALLGQWAPPEERSLMAAITSAGALVGIIITMPLTAFLCKSWYGWPLSYYFYGSLGIFWVILFFLFGADSPRTSRTISEAELKYIETSLDVKQQTVVKMAPWKDIFSSMPVWAVTISQVGLRWEQLTILTEMPIFMNDILGFELQSNGMLSALPYLISLFICMSIGRLSDFIINQKYLSRGSTRKVIATVSTTGTAAALLCLGLLPQSQMLSMTLLVLAVAIDSISHGSSLPNIIDLSPNFSGIIMAISNAAATISAILSPLVVQVVVVDTTDASQWAIVFCIGAGIVVVTNLFYIYFASGEVQPWNDTGDKDVKPVAPEIARASLMYV